MQAENSLIGVGLYSLPEASAITGIPSAVLSRWLFGYTSNSEGHKIHHAPVWTPQLQGYEQKALGFMDLLEARFVYAFRKHGVSLQAVRAASEFAKECFNSDHPFTCREFKTDGRSIFAELIKSEGLEEEALIDLVKRQYAFKAVIGPSLYKGITYSETGEPLSWHPHGNRHIVLDPRRSFGRPIDQKSGVPTEVLYHAFKVEKDAKFVARLYEVDLKAVAAAIEFEQGLFRDEVVH
ncbi:hypothetical protein [Marinimicrobium sp. LS-A18]|uniref:hypothetical protein n=1 Tax=Marinimicrobium sp. LS-A18 TaxID=1381596 RepID=UPI00046473EE|nr:hypothetical protein [Marinimicrobium sp. LS-A18]